MSAPRWLRPALIVYAVVALGVLAIIVAGAVYFGRTR